MNQNYYDPNLCYNSNSSSFDQYQPPQYSVTHQPLHIKSMADLLLEEKLSQALQALCEKLNKNIQEKQEEKNVAEEQAAKVSSQYWKPPIYYDDDDDDEESSIPLKDIISELPLSIAITPDFPITNSLIIEDEHLDTIPETESDKENESSVKDLYLTPNDVFTAKKPLISSRLAIMEPSRDIMVPTTPLKTSLIQDFIGQLFTKMPMTWSHGGIDFIGPFPSSLGNKYILVAVDYLSKWVEAKALPINDARVVVKILKSLFARFGTPRAIISNRGTHFFNDQFAKVMLKYGVTHHHSTAYHPQTSRQVEASNRGLKVSWKGPIAPDYEISRACCFVLRSLELQSLA
ncbi:reverse transcriptase domain-containing protein [Tanacetum coccineum]